MLKILLKKTLKSDCEAKPSRAMISPWHLYILLVAPHSLTNCASHISSSRRTIELRCGWSSYIELRFVAFHAIKGTDGKYADYVRTHNSILEHPPVGRRGIKRSITKTKRLKLKLNKKKETPRESKNISNNYNLKLTIPSDRIYYSSVYRWTLTR